MAKEYRNFNGEIRNLQKKSEFIYEVDVWLLTEKVNRNNWRYTDIAGNKDQFAGTPLLIAYVNGGRTVGDGHNFRMEMDADGNESPSFTDATAERIIGALSENFNDIRIQQDENGVEWVVGKGFIWKWYAKEAVEKIEEDSRAGKPMSISIETLVTESHMDGDVEVEDKYTILGTTLLGDGIAPAVENARIVALQEIESEFKELKLRAASYMSGEKEENKEGLATNETQNEPQNIDNKGERIVKVFSKKQVASLASKFEGYTVLSAGQDDNGIHVCLLSKDGSTAVYTMDSVEDIVDERKISVCAAQAVFAGDEWEMSVEVCDLTDTLSASIITANAELENANAELAKANSTIETMTAKEMKRRLSAAKAKAQETLSKFNENRMDKVDSKILESINESIENGDFSECENAEGDWVGEEEVMNQVLAACAKAVMEMDKVTAQKNNSQYVWDGLQSKQTVDNGDVASLLSTIPLLNK